MIDYSDFTVSDFVLDEAFQTHVKHPTTESMLFWQQWLEWHPHKAEEVRQARLIILSMDFRRTPEQKIPKELLLQRIRTSIHAENETIVGIGGRFFQGYQKIAAVFLGLIIATASLYLLTYDTSVNHRTAYGEIRHLTLPDGSKMVLNANSSVRFERSWKHGEPREVTLSGEAFFDIVHTDDHQRFVVQTEEVDVEVLGTEFNVQTRRDRTRVVLNSGKVKINPKVTENDMLYMEPGDLVDVSKYDLEVSKRKVDPEHFTSWRKKQLIFKATLLGEIAQTLEDNYGWKVTFEEESIKAFRFTGAVSTESFKEVEALLFTISESFNLEISLENDQLTIKKK